MTHTAINTIDELVAALGCHELRRGTQAHLRDDVGTALAALGISFHPRYEFGSGLYADYFLPDHAIVIECVTSVKQPLAILGRFAEQRSIESLLLISGRQSHEPERHDIKGKPLRFMCVAGNDY